MSEGNISGIHNYCDRWCERCFFTSRCAVYAETSDLKPEEQDIRNKAFWQRLSANFSKAQNLLEQAAERYGIDLNAIKENIDETREKETQLREESENHPIAKLSWDYSELAHAWLKTQPGMLEKLNQLKTDLTMGVESQEDAREKTVMIKDSLAVIQWYSTFIHVKLMRAIMGKLDKEEDNFLEEDDQRDFNGSAKVALIAIERSMQAWIRLFDLLPQQEDDFLNVLATLEKLKTMVNEVFPEAMAFIRPGFDE